MYEYDVRVLLLLLGSTAHHGLTAEHTGLLQLGELPNAALVPTLAGTYREHVGWRSWDRKTMECTGTPVSSYHESLLSSPPAAMEAPAPVFCLGVDLVVQDSIELQAQPSSARCQPIRARFRLLSISVELSWRLSDVAQVGADAPQKTPQMRCAATSSQLCPTAPSAHPAAAAPSSSDPPVPSWMYVHRCYEGRRTVLRACPGSQPWSRAVPYGVQSGMPSAQINVSSVTSPRAESPSNSSTVVSARSSLSGSSS
jgi:hypothetical protein